MNQIGTLYVKLEEKVSFDTIMAGFRKGFVGELKAASQTVQMTNTFKSKNIYRNDVGKINSSNTFGGLSYILGFLESKKK